MKKRVSPYLWYPQRKEFSFPFSQKATITFSLPADASIAQLSITDANGKVVSTYSLSAGSTEQIINANKLSAGVYQYSLIVNGKMMDSKQMVIVK